MIEPRDLDGHATIRPTAPRLLTERERALRVREAMMFLIRAWEEMYDLPRSIPAKRERE